MHAHRYMCAIRWEIKRKLLYYYYRTGAFVSRGRTTKERAWPTIIIYIYIYYNAQYPYYIITRCGCRYLSARFWSDFAICLRRKAYTTKANANIANIYSNYTKKTYQNETKIANTRDSYDRSSVTELRRREKKIILVTTQPLTCDPPPPPVNVI